MNEKMAVLARGDIYLVREVYGDCTDPRPCVVIDIASDGKVVVVSLVSAQIDLYDPHQHFLISIDRQEFKATGLKRTSYCNSAPLPNLPPDKFGKQLGRLTGALLREFEDWIC